MFVCLSRCYLTPNLFLIDKVTIKTLVGSSFNKVLVLFDQFYLILLFHLEKKTKEIDQFPVLTCWFVWLSQSYLTSNYLHVTKKYCQKQILVIYSTKFLFFFFNWCYHFPPVSQIQQHTGIGTGNWSMPSVASFVYHFVKQLLLLTQPPNYFRKSSFAIHSTKFLFHFSSQRYGFPSIRPIQRLTVN